MGLAAEGPTRELEEYRAYLTCLARQNLDRRLQAKVDLSGVVNQALYEAHRQSRSARAPQESDRPRWLRQILARKLIDAVRPFRGKTRDATRERSIEAGVEQSSARLAQWLAAEHTSPSGAAVRNEDLARLAGALDRLPEEQRTAVECHHLGGLSLADTARRMRRSKAAVAGLLYRGLNRLRAELTQDESS
jgi:RNA polymerase sigma-70 factor (ECF subfamily)